MPVPAPFKTRAAVSEKTFALVIEDPAGFGLAPRAVKSVAYFPYDDGLIDYAARQTVQSKDGQLVIEATRGYRTDPKRADGVIVVNAGAADMKSYAIETAFDGPMPAMAASSGAGGNGSGVAGLGGDQAAGAAGSGSTGRRVRGGQRSPCSPRSASPFSAG